MSKKEPKSSPQTKRKSATTSQSMPSFDPLPDLPDYDPDPADGVRVGESPVPGLTLRRILRGHTDGIGRIAWSPDGRFLASPSNDKTIRIWDITHGECVAVLEGHIEEVNSVAWSPDGSRLASGSEDHSIYIWEINTQKPLTVLDLRDDAIEDVTWSPDGLMLASGGVNGIIYVWNTVSWKIFCKHSSFPDWILCLKWSPKEQLIAIGTRFEDSLIHILDLKAQKISKVLRGHQAGLVSLSWLQDGQTLISGSQDKTIRIWDVVNEQEIRILEGHTNIVTSTSVCSDGRLLASKSADGSVKFWHIDNWRNLATLPELTATDVNRLGFPSLAFNPQLPLLATLGEKDTVIRIWDLDIDVLLSQTITDLVRYTTAKVVLVGDSGVGKTGLGWRLAHGAFKEQASTHGQQFWVIDALGTTRKDGTECEAVLWDLAGQHVYRPIHSIFLDNVDASLVLFDPSNRQEPLKGAQFWLEQLKGKGQLPPSVLVGARVDRGAPVLSQDELAQFCQRYGVSGGYISTSAKTGEGLEALIELLKDQIPWDAMTTTVTTRTFKRVKDYVLTLKENLALEEEADQQGVLVSPEELRAQLEAAWQAGDRPFDFALDDTMRSDWQFTDAEMMTAVGHLETHGYVIVLQSSSGKTHILLAPDLLVKLASSIVLLAFKHPRELGAVSETDLLQGCHTFEELEGLDESERQVLLDAAVLRFLEHDICFRETFTSGTLLIFPGLIKQKRPLVDDFPATDDVSYIGRGRVENLYAMLVVLLGYTPSFVRINQWQNQAQYEMGKGEICGFRMIADREGEIELVLYYSDQMPQSGRDQFQALFERFLYKREVEVTRFLAVACPEGHRMDRATVVRLTREGKSFAFCAECGQKVELPKLDQPGIGTSASDWLEREEAASRLRSTYEQYLTRVKGYRRGWATPRCYLSRAPGQEDCAADLVHDLQDAGVYIIAEASQVKSEDYVILLDTPDYQRAYHNPTPAFEADVELVRARLAEDKQYLISIKLDNEPASVPQHDLDSCELGNFCDLTHYPVSLFNLVLELYAIPLDHASFEKLRESLHQQWERMPREVATDDDTEDLREQETKINNDERGDISMSEQYVDFDLHIGPNGHIVASSIEGQASAEIPTEVPRNIPLSLKLIEKHAADADLLKEVGQALYDWLFPGPIHTHFQQTEAVARRDAIKMRLRLRVEPEEIASLPLEFLYREIGGYYIAVNPDTVLSRYLDFPMPSGYVRRREGPLHMLAIIADPTDQTRLPPDEWESIIKDALAGPLASGQMALQTVKRATRKAIRDTLLQQKPDIIQFVGHGIYKNGKGYLVLVDEDTDKTWLVDDERFANLYMGHDDHLGLISLATCESAKSDDPQGFLGIAPKLVQRGVPAVVAMQYKVLIKTAKIFLEDFYTAVAARKPIDWATQSARNAVSLELGFDNREFATPVLYMRAKDGEVF